MAKVFVLTYGSYSDYRIEAVFSSRENAEEYQRRHNLRYTPYGDSGEIEEYDLDPMFALPKTYYFARILGIDFDHPEVKPAEETAVVPRQAAYAAWHLHYHYWRGYGVGDTAEQAMQSAYDNIAQSKARLAEL